MSTGIPDLFHTDRQYSGTNLVGLPQASEQASNRNIPKESIISATQI
jgi:hypothetical protein